MPKFAQLTKKVLNLLLRNIARNNIDCDGMKYKFKGS